MRFCLPVIFALLVLSGCETTPSTTATPTAQSRRIAELKGTYDKMPEAPKPAAAAGNLVRGQSPELVYIALGRPDEILTSADGRVTTWTYRNYLPPPPPKTKQEAAKKEKFQSNFARQSAVKDPLQDAVGAFQYNLSRQMVPTTDPDNLDFDKYKEQKRPDQSWADYARYNTNRELAKKLPGDGARVVTKLLDDGERAEYVESLRKSPIADPTTVKLAVVFLGPQVADAIVNDSVSAFAVANP